MQGGTGDGGRGGQVRSAKIALGRDEQAAEDAPVEVGQQAPIAGDEVDVSEPGLDHAAIVAW